MGREDARQTWLTQTYNESLLGTSSRGTCQKDLQLLTPQNFIDIESEWAMFHAFITEAVNQSCDLKVVHVS